MATLTTSIFQVIFFLPIAIRRYRQIGLTEGDEDEESADGDAGDAGDNALPA